MIVTCTNCTTRLQLDDAKVPARAFTVRCPKCQQIINAQPPPAASDNSALGAGGDLPATTRTQREARMGTATQIQVDTGGEIVGAAAAQNGSQDLARMLAALLRQGGGGGGGGDATARGGVRSRPVWDRRRALVCMSTTHGDEIARGLSASEYEVSVAQDAQQAVGFMREAKMDVVVLDPEFDMGRQGAAQVTREVNMRRPAERRRVLLVEVSPAVRTGDAQAAFLANVNLVVNTRDVADLPPVLERTIGEFNELYKDLNRALGVSEL
jgi:predicted Zn finger-like uncharacterized protein